MGKFNSIQKYIDIAYNSQALTWNLQEDLEDKSPVLTAYSTLSCVW